MLRRANRGDINRYGIEQSAQFLKSPPADYIWAPRLLQSGESDGVAWLVQQKIPGVMLSDLIAQDKPYDERNVLRGVLQQLVVLEKAGLYHGDLRAWNIVIGDDFFPSLIDYNEISPAKLDCVWPDDIFLAFFLFVHEVVTHRVFDTEPSRPPFISPYNIPQPYRGWLERMWSLPTIEWSFAFLLSTFDQPLNESPASADSATALWMKSIEQNIDTLNITMRSMSNLVLRLHEVVIAKKQ